MFSFLSRCKGIDIKTEFFFFASHEQSLYGMVSIKNTFSSIALEEVEREWDYLGAGPDNEPGMETVAPGAREPKEFQCCLCYSGALC